MNMPDVKRSLLIKTPSHVGIKSDQFFLAQAFLDVIGARLDPEVNTGLAGSDRDELFLSLARQYLSDIRRRYIHRQR